MAAQETQAFTNLKNQLREMFQLDRGDLDFGIYRIMNQKREEVTKFLDEELLPKVKQVLEKYKPSDLDEKQKELKEAEANPGKFSAEYVDGLRSAIKKSVDINKLENEVYSDLYNFFKRYYSEGDFMSLRRYKEGVYALPYEGEEVKLHWANHDQYYIKTSEDFKNYTFKTKSGKKVRFEVVAGNTEKNNNKAAEGKERRFILHIDNPVTALNDELTIRFEYRPHEDKKKKQDALNQETIEQLFNLAELASWQTELKELAPTEKNATRTLLEKHLTDYTAKNSFDYFIHKDLGRFLKQELDFFIKNEVMHLDDIENEDAPKVESYLGKVKAMRKIAGKIIAFLAQLEDFQKKLWLKKKFVLETNYCVTLDKIAEHEDLLEQIFNNENQLNEWKSLFDLNLKQLDKDYEKLSWEDFLNKLEYRYLLVDTKFFDKDFKYKLLSIFDDLDEQTDGLLINSENFQALKLLQDKYKEQVKCVYIDPPYNTGDSKILYKNTFDSSAWLSLMENRIKESQILLDDDFVYYIAIDDYEMVPLSQMVDTHLPFRREMIVVNHHPQGGKAVTLANTHEYMLAMVKQGSDRTLIGRTINEDTEERPYKRSGTAESNFRYGRPNSFYAILVDPTNYKVVGVEEPPERDEKDYPTENTPEGYKRVYPIGKGRTERVWRNAYETGKKLAELGKLKSSDKLTIYQLIEHGEKKTALFSNWTDKKYNSGTNGANLLNDIVGPNPFGYPKSVYTVEDAIFTHSDLNGGLVLDFFAGSGTTGHAVINLNREDEGKRKYILVEMGDYFDTVLKPRIQKAVYSENWKNGKPVSREGISQVIKYMSLEQYEDSLDNLEFHQDEIQKDILKSSQTVKEQYMLGYMLDVETRGSQSLLNVDAFANPYSYKLRITRDDDTQTVNVDLVETLNYLLGLTVKTIDKDKSGILTITGINSLGEKSLIIWRNAEDIDNNKLDEWFSKRYSSKDFEFDAIYVNGDNNIENMKKADETWKVRLIEAEFKRLMFEVEGI